MPINLLKSDMTVISGGLGNDATFDYELESRWGANVAAFDPTPSVLTALQVGALDPCPKSWRVVPCALTTSNGSVELSPK